jgi:hypothetical protein
MNANAHFTGSGLSWLDVGEYKVIQSARLVELYRFHVGTVT